MAETYACDALRDLALRIHDLRDRLPDIDAADDRSQALQLADHDLDAIEELIEHAELEVRNVAKEERGRSTKQLRQLQNEADKVQQSVNRLRGGIRASAYDDSDDDDLGLDDGPIGTADPSRARLLTSEARLDRTSERLRNSERLAAEAEEYGGSILSDLYGQRDTILRMNRTLDETDDHLLRSRRTLRAMALRALTSRLIWYIILIMLLLIIGIIVFLKVT